jgi:hypothetical protein
VSQQTIVAVAITLAVVAVILVVVLLWPLGRLPWPSCIFDITFKHFDTEVIVSTSNSIRVEIGRGPSAYLYTA